jgi:hypothetical protein
LGPRDTVAGLIFLGGGFHFKSVKRSPLNAYADLCQQRPHFAIEAVLVHAEVAGRVAEADEAWRRGTGSRRCRCFGQASFARTIVKFKLLKHDLKHLVRFRSFRDELSLKANHALVVQKCLPKFRGKNSEYLGISCRGPQRRHCDDKVTLPNTATLRSTPMSVFLDS